MTNEPNEAPEGVSEDTSAADPVAETEEQTLGDDAAAETDEDAEGEAEDQPQPKRRSAQERINEQTRARREAEREAAHWRRIALESASPPAARQSAPQDAEPDPNDYYGGEADPAYIRELLAYATRHEVARLVEQREREAQARTVEQTWSERQQAFARDKPDYFEVLDREWVCTPPMADAIRTADDGAAVAYHLASNPAEARRIAALNPLAQVREIGRLEVRLSKTTETSAKTVSDAPRPAPQIRGTGGKYKPGPDTDDFAAFERNY